MNDKVAAKLDRLEKAVRGTGLPDRVPVGDNFWTGYLLREREMRGASFDPYLFHDLDYVIVTPNMDPRIQPFEVLEDDGVNVRLKTGFGATIRRSGAAPMPHFDAFSVNEPEEMEAFRFDDPRDPRRFTQAGDDQINGVGDAIGRNIPAWTERLKKYENDTVLFGSVCEAYEGPAEKSDSRYGRSFKQLLVLSQPILQSNLRSSARAKKELKGSAAGAQRSLPG